ncbi:MAG: SGNH/GDSL hydrolase family protein [Candidatus Thiodiazotropha sp. (ex Dulcina madagascariensis)]|nr:SGNH/GDSL hydrolase family protein [Candidatus Thiodiazotropha sp. (ex Dulcina madagascariensis)]MCU7924976.1 SGNH/GDSL hydrolase family protein [Candidatus Thiodiazotropha sp. (ex Dulcina madagascariensis)]
MKKNTAGNIILLVVVLVVTLVITELLLMALGISHPRLVQRDDNVGTAYRPGIEFFQKDEGEAWIKINAEGFRDKERELDKPHNTIRIAVVGDSYTDAFSVPIETRYTEILESELNNHCNALAGRKVEVLNFGMSGYGTVQELQTLRHKVWKYSPDWVVLGFLPYNDVRNNVRALEKNDGIPYFLYKDEKLELDASFRDSPSHHQTWQKVLGYKIIDNSRLAQVLYRINILVKDYFLAREQGRAKKKDTPLEVGLDDSIFHPPKDSVWKNAWQVTEGVIALMDKEVSDHGARFLLVTLTQGTVVHPDVSVRQAFQSKLGVESLHYPQQRMSAFASRQGIDILNLLESFQSYARDNQVYLHGFENTKLGKGHWNVEGNILAGKMIAEKVCSRF